MTWLRHRVPVPALLALVLGHPVAVAAQGSVPPRSGADLFVLDLAGTPLGEIPTGIKQLQGMLEVVLKDGVPMLKASARSEFLITLPQALPADFTLEFELVPKACCNPQDLSFEGTPTIKQGAGSAHVLWDSDGYLAIIGGGPDTYEAPMPEELRTTLPGVLTQVVATVEGPTIKLYTNGKRLFTLDRRFARGRVLRVFLGGQDDNTQAVYLARLRVATGIGAPSISLTATSQAPGSVQRVGTGPIPETISSQSAASSGAITQRQTTTVPTTPGTLVTPPIGAGLAPAAAPQQAAGTPGRMRLDNSTFAVSLIEGGSAAAAVVVTRLSDGSVKKNLGALSFEPLVFDVSLDSPIDVWLQSSLAGNFVLKNGSLFGGVVTAAQQLDFRNATLHSVMIPTLDASSSAPGFFRVSLAPEVMSQAPLSGATSGGSPTWLVSDFSFSMGTLETRQVVRIESFTITASTAQAQVGAQRNYASTPSQPEVSNLLVTFVENAASPATNWLAWYDDFVLKGNNGDAQEQSFTLQLGTGQQYAVTPKVTLNGYGVGIVALRALPPPAGTTVRRLQAELYVERLELIP